VFFFPKSHCPLIAGIADGCVALLATQDLAVISKLVRDGTVLAVTVRRDTAADPAMAVVSAPRDGSPCVVLYQFENRTLKLGQACCYSIPFVCLLVSTVVAA
jgi:hypothetical protein